MSCIIFVIVSILFISTVKVQSINVHNINSNLESSSDGLYEVLVNKTIEIVKGHLKNGIPELGIPPLDPLHIDYQPFNINVEKYLKGDLHVEQLKLKGVPEFTTTHLKVKLGLLKNPEFNFTFLFQDIVFDTEYFLNSTLLQFIPLHGKGELKVHFKDFQVDGNIALDKTEKLNYLIKDINLFFTLGDSDITLSGLLDNEELCKSLASTIKEHLAPWINQSSHDINSLLGPFLMDYFNELILNNY